MSVAERILAFKYFKFRNRSFILLLVGKDNVKDAGYENMESSIYILLSTNHQVTNLRCVVM